MYIRYKKYCFNNFYNNLCRGASEYLSIICKINLQKIVYVKSTFAFVYNDKDPPQNPAIIQIKDQSRSHKKAK